jgi:hypothetical protein
MPAATGRTTLLKISIATRKRARAMPRWRLRSWRPSTQPGHTYGSKPCRKGSGLIRCACRPSRAGNRGRLGSRPAARGVAGLCRPRNQLRFVEVEATGPIPPRATNQGRRQMLRTAFAIAVAGLIFAAVSGPSQAAPLAPLPAGITAHLNDLTDVAWRRCWRDRWGRMRCHRCWRDRWGRVRCR